MTGQKEPKPYPMPIVDMASETKTFKIGDNAPQPPDPTENKEWMRWNNYGIGLLDAQQYEASVHAFERVAALRPDYADAFTNMAIVEISWEKYDDAKGNLAKALTLLPGDPRALYYRASSSATPARSKKPSPTLKPCSPSIPAPKTPCAS
jgi:tetratricopeptide (TPR) repeat protein